MHDSVDGSILAVADTQGPVPHRGGISLARPSVRVDACPACAGERITQLLEIRDVPVFCNVLWSTAAQALSAATGDLALAACRDCGHVFNAAFDAVKVDYSDAYENSLHFSQHFSTYAERLAAYLVDTYDIRGKDVIDVGCGRGDFLSVICNAGNNRGCGFDKSYAPSADGPRSRNLTFIPDFYGRRYADYPCDLLCCRHVLEHVERPDEFLAEIRHTIATKTNAVVFFEVPNAAYVLRDLGIWDLIYEHYSYFCVSSLHRLFARHGFSIQRIAELYDGQFIGIECTLGTAHPPLPGGMDATDVLASLDTFPERYQRKLAHWRSMAARFERSGKRVAIWGAGSKGVTFLNLLKSSAIVGVIDLNPRKHGRHVPGTGHEVMSPDRVPELKPDVVIAMNAVYANEIRNDLASRGLSPELLTA